MAESLVAHSPFDGSTRSFGTVRGHAFARDSRWSPPIHARTHDKSIRSPIEPLDEAAVWGGKRTGGLLQALFTWHLGDGREDR